MTILLSIAQCSCFGDNRLQCERKDPYQERKILERFYKNINKYLRNMSAECSFCTLHV